MEVVKAAAGAADTTTMPARLALRAGRPVAPPRNATPGRRSATAIWCLFGLMGALLAGDLLFLSLRTSWDFSALLDGWLVVAFEVVASTICLTAALRRVRHRRVALLLGVASLSWAIGDLFESFESLNGATPPSPSIANGF